MIDKERLIELIKESKSIELVVPYWDDYDCIELIAEHPLNDFVLKENGILELWYNNGDYEI